MPFCEFIIMSYGHDKKLEREFFNIQYLAWHSLIGSHTDPKKIPTLEKFTQAPGEKAVSKLSDLQKERMLAASAEYYTKLNQSK